MPTSKIRAVATLLVVLLNFNLCSCTRAARVARHTDRADQYFEANDYAKAKIEYMNVLRGSGPNAKAITRLGEIWYNQGDYLQAAPFLVRARELDPNNLDNRIRLVRVLSAVAPKSEARKEAAAILQQSPDNGEALLLLAEASLAEAEIAGTERSVEAFAKKDSPFYHLALSQLALRRGNTSAAEKSAADAITADPKLPVAHVAAGMIEGLKKNAAGARKEFKMAADLAPARSNIRISYADFLSKNGALAEAESYLQDLTKQAKDFLPAWTALARIAVENKKFDEALADVQHVLSENAENPDALLLQSQAWLGKGETEKAVAQLERLNQKFSQIPPLKFQLARAYLQANNPVQAAAVLDQAIASDPKNVDAILLRSEIDLRAGKAPLAVARLEDLAKAQPTLLQGARLLAQAYVAVQRLDDATAVLKQEIQSVPNWAEPYFVLGTILRQQQKNDEARAQFTKASDIEPQNPGPIEQLVEMDISDKQFEAASQRIQGSLFQKDPNSATGHFVMAKVLLAQNKADEARSELEKAVASDSSLEVAFRLLISTYVAQGKLPEAGSRLEEVVRKNPKATGALVTLGMVYSAQKDYPKARDAYEKVIGLEPNSAVALNNLAFLYAERFNQLDKAQDFAAKARSIAPADANVADTLGWILYKGGDYQQAMSVLREAASRLGDDPEVLFHYGMACYMMGATSEARTALQKVVESAGDFPGKEDARNHLALLGSDSASALSLPQLQSLAKANPNDIVAQTRLGEALEKEGSYPDAAAAYERAFQLNSKLVGPALKLAQLNAGPLKQKAKAFEYAKKARDLAPNDPAAAATLGGVAYDAGNFQWAYSVLQEAARQKADDAALLQKLAWSAYSIGKVQEAQQAMERAGAASRDPAVSEDAKKFLAMLPLAEPNATSAASERDVQLILTAQPDYVPALMADAAFQIQQKHAAEAIAKYNRVLELFPDFAPALKELAALLADDPAQQAKAYDLATSARKVLVDDPALSQTLARLSYARKDYRRVLSLLDGLQGRNALNVRSLFYLGMSQAQLNNKDAARDNLQKSLAAGLSGADADEAKSVIEQTGNH